MNDSILDQIVTSAKTVILETGVFPTTTFVEWDHTNFMGLCIMGDKEGDTAYERCQRAFKSGRLFAQKFLLGKRKFRKSKVTGVCTAHEVWYTQLSPGASYKVRPTHDPNRKEALQVVTIDVDTMSQSHLMYEIVRAKEGTLDLLAIDSKDGEISGAGLPCFLAGVHTANQDMSQAIHACRQTYEKYTAIILEQL